MATIPLSMVFMMIYINICSLLVCQINIFWDSTHIDVNWHQFDVIFAPKMIENAQNRQFLSCKRPQYHFSMVFNMVYINICSLLMCQMNIYWDSTHIDVNWRQFDIIFVSKMIENAQNCQILLCVYGHNTTLMLSKVVYINLCNLLLQNNLLL